jgi:predicted  nucleic acid-binding Zn-ribbon protein
MAADGSIVFSTEIDDKKAQADLKKLEEKSKKIESELSESTGKKSAIEKQLEDAKGAAEETQKTIAELQAKLKKTTAETGGGDPFSQMYSSQIASAKASLDEQRTAVDKLEKKYDSITQKVESQTNALNSAKDAAGDLAARLAGAKQQTSGTSAAAAEAAKRMDKFSQHVKTLAKRVLVFSLITAGLRALKNYLWEAIQQNDEAVAAIARLKGALMTLAQPIVEVVIPAFTVLINVITRIVTAVAKLISMLFGTTIQKSAAGAKALNKQKDAIDGVGEAAKEASKYLAGFDELNVMDSQDNSSASGSGGFDTSGGIAPDFTSMIDDGLSAILELFTGAALLALGAILTFSGANIPLGIALMVLGAIAIWDAISENWDAIKEMLQGPLGWAVSILSVAALVIGAILIFSGANIPLGLGLLIMGAIGLASAVAANWNYIVEALQGPLGLVVGLLGAALLVLGIVLLFTGVGVPLGLGLILIGATGLAAAIAPNWNFLKEKLVGCWESIKNWWNTKVKKFVSEHWWAQLGLKIIGGLLAGLINKWKVVVTWVTNAVKWITNAFSSVLNFLSGGKGTFASRNNLGSGGIGGYKKQTMPALRAVQVPALAQGAVIPANREFLAVLGDQKRGTNIEAPADLIRQIFREESGNSGGDIVIRFTGELAQLARVLTPEITRQQRQNQRSWGGGSL